MPRIFRDNQSIEGKSTTDLVDLIGTRLGNPPDLVSRDLTAHNSRLVMIYLDGLADTTLLSETILETLIENHPCRSKPLESALPYPAVEFRTGLSDVLDDLLNGKTVLFKNRGKGALVLDTLNPKTRNVDEPSVETVIRGPREAFVEDIGTNVALVRLGLKTPDLRIKNVDVGRLVNTRLNVLYVEGIVAPAILKQVMQRLNEKQVERVIGHGTVTRMMEASSYPLFPTTLITERPDRVVAGLLEGRVAILIDRTPFCVMVPSVFVEHLQSSEDYLENALLQSIIRTMRYIMLHLAVLGPALYVAITTYHQEMVPSTLLFSLVDQRELVPFPAVFEAIIMGIVFEGLREAGVRLPRPVGQTVSIVGGIVLGQAAITAGLVSPAMIIVVGLTGIASFTVPSLSLDTPQLILRIVFLLGGAVLGLYGVIIIYLFVLAHLVSLRSFGVPYLFPLAPAHKAGVADSFIIVPPEI